MGSREVVSDGLCRCSSSVGSVNLGNLAQKFVSDGSTVASGKCRFARRCGDRYRVGWWEMAEAGSGIRRMVVSREGGNDEVLDCPVGDLLKRNLAKLRTANLGVTSAPRHGHLVNLCAAIVQDDS
jgi:hypothetical protein